MNWNRTKLNWSELKGKATQNCMDLTCTDMKHVHAHHAHRVGKTQDLHDIDKAEVGEVNMSRHSNYLDNEATVRFFRYLNRDKGQH